MATHPSVLAWRIPGTGEPGGLLSTGLHRVRHNWSNLAAAKSHLSVHHIGNFLNLGSIVGACILSYVWLSATPWTSAQQTPLSPGFSRQEYWNGWPFPPPGIFPTQGLKLHLSHLLHWEVDSLPLRTRGWKHYRRVKKALAQELRREVFKILVHQWGLSPLCK